MEIRPVNGHLLVKPLEHKSILPSEKGLFEEIGEIIEIASDIRAGYNCKAGGAADREAMIHIGDKVFYDGWRSAKYPTGDNEDDFIFLVRWEDVRAIQKKEDLYYCNGADSTCPGNEKCPGHNMVRSTYGSLKKDV